MTVSKNAGDGEMKRIHFVMQGKGGAGKSFVASLICQFLTWEKHAYKGYALGPFNNTLEAINSLNVSSWDVLKDASIGSKIIKIINEESFDRLMIDIDESDEKYFVVDSGSTSFIPFNNYLLMSDVFNALKGVGINSTVHCVLRGGLSTHDCLNCFNELCDQHDTGSVKIIVWLNEVEGKICADDEDGVSKEFEGLKVYLNHKDSVLGIVRIPEVLDDLQNQGIHSMLKNNQTIDDYLDDPTAPLDSKQKVKDMKKMGIIYNNLQNRPRFLASPAST